MRGPAAATVPPGREIAGKAAPDGPFTGTWRGPDPADGSETTIVLVQTGDRLTGTFTDAYSPGLPQPGFEGSGSGMLTSGTTAEITFDLTRSDGSALTTVFLLTLSNENNTLSFTCDAGCPLQALERQ
jgi:hypothetical protein